MKSRGAGWICIIAGVAVAGCARPVTPAGGDVPDLPLAIVETRPQNFDIVAPFDGPIVIEFERRISERLTGGALRDAVVVSPHLGDVEVRTRRRSIEISMEGGFQARSMYRISVLPRFQDLYENRMAEAFDLIFSTADELEPNLVAGLVTDRLTLQEVEGARVDVIPMDEGFVHSTMTDSTGIFTFPHLPAGEYTLVAYNDLNRNRQPDFPEPQDSLAVNLARGDTVILTDPALLAPDTTAAVLQDAVPIDTLTLRLTFDDYLDPVDPLDEVTAQVFGENVDDPEVIEILHLHEWEARAPTPDPSPDLPAPDPDAPPTPPTDPPPPVDGPPNGEVLPAREIILVLSLQLEPGAPYRVEVEAVTNINGVPNGGGEADFEGPPEPEPEPDPDDPDPDPTDPAPLP